jgi:hypothetical protein
MSLHLLIAPPATGKTQACLELVSDAFQARPMPTVWMLVPDQNQADEIRGRLARRHSVLPAHVATFGDLYIEILEQAGGSLPVAGNVMLRRLLQEITRSLCAGGQLPHYGPICGLPGFLLEVGERIAELKQGLVLPATLSEAARRRCDPGLTDLAKIYEAYQLRLQELGWADIEGLNWLADVALTQQPDLLSGIDLLVVDGFENFSLAQMRTLQALTQRAGETWVSLTGSPEMTRAAHQRFAGALKRLNELGAVEVHSIATTYIYPHPRPLLPEREKGKSKKKTVILLHQDTAKSPNHFVLRLPSPSQGEGPGMRVNFNHADPCFSDRLSGSGLPPFLPPTLQAIEAGLFEPSPSKVQPGPDLARIEARSPAEEAREALRWLKTVIVRKGVPLGGCAIAVPELETYRAPLRAAAAEFGLPLRFGRGALLGSTPAAAALADLLSLALVDFPLRPLLDTIRSPYFDFSGLGLAAADAKRLEIASRYGQVVQGMQQWREVLQLLASRTPAAEPLPELDEEESRVPHLAAGEEARRLLDGLTGLAQRLAPPAAALPLRAWALWLESLLEELKFFECAGSCGEAQLCHTLEQALAALARSEALTGPCSCTYPEFLKEWGALLASLPVQEDGAQADQPAIRVLGLMAARGVRFKALAVVGLAEGAFPAVERADPLLSEEVRHELGLELKLGQEQAGLFYQVVTRADQFLLLTRPYLAKDGEAWEASPYWNALQELLADAPARIRPDDPRPLAEAASENEFLFWAARRSAQTGQNLPVADQTRCAARWKHIGETQAVLASRQGGAGSQPYNGSLADLAEVLQQRYGERAGWSASRLEAYATCPFSFLIASALGLEVLTAPQIGYQASQLGSLLHAVLEQVYCEAPDPADVAQVLARLPHTAGRIFASAPQVYQFRPSLLWEVQQGELLAVLEAAVQGIAGLEPAAGWHPLAFEAKFGLDGQPPLSIAIPGGAVRLHGIVDRIDINPAGELRVIDYKSGGSHLGPQDLIDGRRLQLPIYALAASQTLGLGKVVEGFYWKLFQGEASSLKLSKFKSEGGDGPQGAFAVAAGHIAGIVNGIRQGAFGPQAPQGGCPSYCAAAAWCWQYQSARY